MKIKESGENYLETILLLGEKNGFVRSIDVATELNYTKASVSRAIGILKREEYITIKENGQILFTEKGRKKAEAVYERHRVIADFLVNALGVDEKTAQEDACHIEHIISQKSFDAIKNFNSGK